MVNAEPHIQVHIIDKLPVPFGLVRYGVAPDHPKLKQVTRVFHNIALKPEVKFFGKVEIGKDLTIEDLQATHHAVVICSGAETDRKLNIPGEDLPGVHTATEFVAWYNGHPDYADRQFDLSHESVVILGQGNVASDVCRILAKSVDELRGTDIAAHALEQLAESKLREIHVVGRRGAAQVKFSSKELRELTQLEDFPAVTDAETFKLTESDKIELADKLNEMRRSASTCSKRWPVRHRVRGACSFISCRRRLKSSAMSGRLRCDSREIRWSANRLHNLHRISGKSAKSIAGWCSRASVTSAVRRPG